MIRVSKMEQQDRRVRALASANKKPQSVLPGDPIPKAITIMLLNDFSQLPVLDSNSHAKGILRWPTIIKGLLDAKPIGKASDWATEARTMHRDRSIYDAFDEVLSYEYVLVTQDHTTVCGIVTAYDLGVYSHETLIPYMLVEEVELALRQLVKKHQLDRRKQKGPNDKPKQSQDEKVPSLGELIATLRHEDNWQKLPTRMSQAEFLGVMDTVHRYRNSIMHFNQQPTAFGTAKPALEIQSLKVIARFLSQIGVDGPEHRHPAEEP
jgi:predicted transcriptional regulator